MSLIELQAIFNRALHGTFQRAKIILTFLVLALCGVFVLFFRGVAQETGPWIFLSLTFLPIFLTAGVLFSLGVFLIRVYHDEVKGKEVSYRQILGKSWDVMIGSSYVSIPIVLCYLLLWIGLGLFVLLSQIPGIGSAFNVILSFGPFLINVGALVLIVFNLALLFFVSPILALRGFNQILISRILVQRVSKDPFSNIFLMFIALFPLGIFVTLLTVAAWMTGAFCHSCSNAMERVLMSFFVMIPFVLILAPVVVFFFNFAAESHVLIMKKVRGEM